MIQENHHLKNTHTPKQLIKFFLIQDHHKMNSQMINLKLNCPIEPSK